MSTFVTEIPAPTGDGNGVCILTVVWLPHGLLAVQLELAYVLKLQALIPVPIVFALQ